MHRLLITIEHEFTLKDVVVDVDDRSPGESLIDALAPHLLGVDPRGFTVRIDRSGETVDPSAELGSYQLRSGDRLSVVPQEHRPTDLGNSVRWSMRVVQGPATGEVIELRPGQLCLGRGGAAVDEVDLRDPSVSRRHAVVVVDANLQVRDAGSRYGTTVNGERLLDEPRQLQAGDQVTLGTTVLQVEPPRVVIDSIPPAVVDQPQQAEKLVVAGDSLDAAHLTYEAGSLRFNRPPRVLTDEPRAALRLGPAPDPPPKRRLPLAAALVPVALGVIIYLVTQNALFLLFMAAGPILAVGSYISDRRSGRADFKAKVVAFREDLAEHERAAAAATEQSVRWRNAHAPGPSAVQALATSQAPAVWSRRPSDPDDLALRVGLADQPSFVSVSVEDRGDPDLLAEARSVAARFGIDEAVPAIVPLGERGVVGVVGSTSDLSGMARWLCAQIAVGHSPRDVAIAILAPSHARTWSWTKWLPHVSRLSDEVRSVAADDAEATRLFTLLSEIADRRTNAEEISIGARRTRFTPAIVVFIQPPLRLSPRDMARFIELAPTVGIHVVWIDGDRAGLPNGTRAIIDVEPGAMVASITSTEGGHVLSPIRADALGAIEAEVTARALAPLRDVSAGEQSEAIPDRVDLVDLYDPSPIDPAVLVNRWRTDDGRDLAAFVGVAADGPLRLDLRRDGPHGLVAGTTGAGKSEFLQAMIAGLAVEHPPTRLTFVLIDYKGGAAFKDAVDLPHTVGFVTDLDAHLTQRALVSLNAELKHRESLLAQHGAKDLLDLLRIRADVAPPSLLIVIDEFAALKSEVPEFVEGVVDIAQRGRSLGVHLLLATQKPGGVITGAIQANTNLRIALRVADPQESTDVIGRMDAADIPRSLPGRGLVRTGPAEIRPFQAAYVGGSSGERTGPMVGAAARTFHFNQAERQAIVSASSEPSGPSDLQRLVVGANAATQQLGLPPARRPWLPELPLVLPWGDLGLEGGQTEAGLRAVVGLADEPALQRQEPYVLDLEATGHLIVYGASGSGKTTMLRTIAASLCVGRSSDDLHLYGLDFTGRGLSALGALPPCGDVVFADELDRVRRLISVLAREAADRKDRFGMVGATNLEEYRRATGAPLPAIVLLLDGFGQFWSTMEPLDRSEHVETFTRLVSEGRALGLHVVMTADRRGAVPLIVANTVPGRAVLRMATAEEYLNLGLPELAKAPPLPPGRAFIGTLEVQVAALAAGEASGAEQGASIEQLGARLAARYGHGEVPSIRLLPDVLERSDLAVASGLHQVPLGLEETALSVVGVDLVDNPLFMVTGPDRSGRTTALDVLSSGVEHLLPGVDRYLLGTRRNPLFDRAGGWTQTALGVEACAELAGRIAGRLDEAVRDGRQDPVVVVIDDADELVDGPVVNPLDLIVRRTRDAGGVLLVAMTSFKASRTFTAWVQAIRNNRHGLLLQPDVEDDGEILHVRLPRRAGLTFPAGRGYLVRRTQVDLIQSAQ